MSSAVNLTTTSLLPQQPPQVQTSSNTQQIGMSKVFILDKYFNELQKFWDTEKRLKGKQVLFFTNCFRELHKYVGMYKSKLYEYLPTT